LTAIAVAASALAAALAARVLRPPRSRLRARLGPYTIASRVALGRRPGASDAPPSNWLGSATALTRTLATAFGRVVDAGSEEAMLLRLRQADAYRHVTEESRTAHYRMRLLGVTCLGAAIGLVLGTLLQLSTPAVLVVGILGSVAGAARLRGRIDRAIAARATQARMELYTICQLLALRLQTGGGILGATAYIADKGTGVVSSDLAYALRLHRGGMRADDAFRRIASLTPEPYAARTYNLLATAEVRGTDLATAVLALGEDLQEARRDAIKRSATRKRAAMLIPIIGVMAPVMLLFVVAPVAEIVLGVGR